MSCHCACLKGNEIKVIMTPGGGGGTSNYNALTNKPKINNVELNGNKTSSDLGLQPAGNYALESEVPTKTSDLTNDSGFITGYTETDPTVPSYVKNITQANITSWNNKADISDIPDVSNFITKDVNNLTNYTLKTNTGSLIDLEINNTTYVVTMKLKDVDGNVISTDTIDLPLETVVVSGRYDNTTKEIILTLKNGTTVRFSVADLVSGLQSEITSTNKLSSDLVDDSNSSNKFVTTNEKNIWNNKSDFSGNYNDLTNKPTIPTIPTNVSAFTNDVGYLTQHQDISGKQDTLVAGTNINIASDGKTISATDTTYSDATQSTAGLMSSTDKTKLDGISAGAEVNVQSNWNETNTSSDSYIQNKPTIPPEVTESTVSGWGFTKNTGTYSKPSGGIPKTDLASDIQTSLGKADTALQSETYTGTITSVKMNGSTISSSGEADLGTVLTQHQDVSGKEDKTNKVTSLSASSTDTQYPSAKCIYDLIGNINTILATLTTPSNGGNA